MPTTATSCARYFIRCRAPEMKRAKLLRPDGCLTGRRVYAAMIPGDRITDCLAEMREQNPGWTFEPIPV